DTGGTYNPVTNSWAAISTTNAPAGRYRHTTVWADNEMIVWGGYDGSGYFNTGGRYNPDMDSWTATSTTNAPSGRDAHTAVWTGSEMIVWGGERFNAPVVGSRYNPGSNTWVPVGGGPSERSNHSAVWTGNEMIIWGGYSPAVGRQNTGSRYNPSSDNWTATSVTN